jgi:hypothetical protein
MLEHFIDFNCEVIFVNKTFKENVNINELSTRISEI